MRRRGTIIVVVLLMTAMAAMVVAGLMFRMRAETSAAGAGAKGEQAYAAAISGVQRVIALLQVRSQDHKFWYDNPDVLKNRLVYSDGVNKWYFTVYAEYAFVDDTADREIRYGVVDQSGLININTADEATLLALPNMTNELVDCLMDYRDSDSDARENGAEQEYYSQLEQPYTIKNGPMATLEEVLLIKGFNARIVFGEDANLNGLMEPNEDDGDKSFPPDDHDGTLNTGLRGVATAISYEQNVDSKGQARIDLNGDVEAIAKLDLPDETIDFIRVYRDEGNTFTHPSELLEMTYQTKKTNRELRVRAGTEIDSGVGADQLPIIMDKLSVMPGGNSRTPMIGLVNINSAPPAVLTALSGVGRDLAEQIVQTRADLDVEVKQTIAWLYTEGLVDAATFKAVAPKLTSRGFQFHIRCIGFGAPCGRFRIIEAIVDLAGGKPRITYLRDLTRLGLPFALDEEQEYKR
jgi:type II secretory pathway component PulK